jgi:hypothetical protein
MKFIALLIADFLVVTALIIATSLNVISIAITGPLVFVCILGIWAYWLFRNLSRVKKQAAKSGEELKNSQIGIIATPNAYIGGAVIATLVAAYGYYYFVGIGKIVCIILLVAYLVALAYKWKSRNVTIENMKKVSSEHFKLRNKAAIFGLLAWFVSTLILANFLSEVPNVIISLLFGGAIGVIYFYSKNKSEKSK